MTTACQPKKLLVVDDQDVICRLFHDYFTRLGHTVHIAGDGKQALQFLDREQYDIVFFDCNMPELSGVELVKEIKSRNPRAQRIMMSGYDLINQEFADHLGIDRFLRKPLSLKSVREIVEHDGETHTGGG